MNKFISLFIVCLITFFLLPNSSHAKDVLLTLMNKDFYKEDIGKEPENKIKYLITSELLNKFQVENNITVTKEDLQKFSQFMSNSLKDLKNSEIDLPEIDLGTLEAFRPQILLWKTHKALYEKYGGRVRFQQSGSEPLDAYRDFLREHERNKSFIIHDELIRSSFWSYYETTSDHGFFDEENAKKIMSKQLWEHSEKF